MDLLVNDLSVHEQFPDAESFSQAFGRLMRMRSTAENHGHPLQCDRAFLSTAPIPGMSLQQVIGRLKITVNEKRYALSWLGKAGPFWSDRQHHGPDDYLEQRGNVVTDNALGEAAFRCMHRVECGLVSLSPSDWESTPLEVTWRRDDSSLDRTASIQNWWDAESLADGLSGVAEPIKSWDALRTTSISQFRRLTFADACFSPLVSTPFQPSSANRIQVLLDTLDRLAGEFDESGKRTAAGERLLRDHFSGGTAWFSDSSATEKRDFEDALTFAHPEDSRKQLFCPWHGKERHQTLRLHFSWPIKAGEPVYVVYAGRKLTTR